jgi:hypothetical protein
MVSTFTHDPSRAQRVQTPMLGVFLGSTAGLVGLEFLRHLSSLDQRDQRRVACVSLDTDTGFQSSWRTALRQSTAAHTFSLLIAVPAGITSVPRSEHDQHTYIGARLPQYFANGAGGVRNNGHTALSFNYQEVSDTLEQALTALLHLEGDHGESKVGEVQVNIVAFVGGGTGSGILADIGVLVRELLVKRGLGHRLNLFCLLPELVQGCSTNDLQWRKSNAVASILEVLALGSAAAVSEDGRYLKRVRQHAHSLTNTPLAHEVFLMGDLAVNDPEQVARIVGLDLFMRCADGSGVGAVEHRQWVDRRALGGVDGSGLPTFFGTSWPFEVCFPAHDVAGAFALRSATRMLRLLEASPAPSGATVPTEEEKRAWHKKWRGVARYDASGDPLSVGLQLFRREDFVQAHGAALDALWLRLDRAKAAVETRLLYIRGVMWESELRRIEGLDEGQAQAADRFGRLRHLAALLREYQFVLDELGAAAQLEVAGRPLDLETELLKQGERMALFRWWGGDLAWDVCSAYNESLQGWAAAARRRTLLDLLKELQSAAQAALESSELWLRLAQSREVRRELESSHVPTSTWAGKLEQPHLHRRHLFDLPSLNTQGGGNLAVEALYAWASGDEQRFAAQADQCIAYLARPRSSPSQAGGQEVRLTPRECFREIVAFFTRAYRDLFGQMNLLDLLDRAAPAEPPGVSRPDLIRGYLEAHLRHIRAQMRSPLVFEPQLWDKGTAVLETTIYLGCNWKDGAQQEIMEEALVSVDRLVYRGQSALLTSSQDPHGLQVLCGQHAISLTCVGDFYRDQHSAMQHFLSYQGEWEASRGTGLSPVHSSGELQRLVWDKDALGYGQSLPARLIRVAL